MFYFLIFSSLTITLSVIRIASLKQDYSAITRTLMMFIPSATWIYIIWQTDTPSNIYVGLFAIVLIFEISLRISSKVEERFRVNSAH